MTEIIDKGHGLMLVSFLIISQFLIGKADVPIDPMLGFTSSNLTSLNRLHSLHPNQKIEKTINIQRTSTKRQQAGSPFRLTLKSSSLV